MSGAAGRSGGILKNTFIVGAPDSTTDNGFGTDAVGGVYMHTTANPA